MYTHCTYCNAVRDSNFACALSRSPTMRSIQLVIIIYTCKYVYTANLSIKPVKIHLHVHVYLAYYNVVN